MVFFVVVELVVAARCNPSPGNLLFIIGGRQQNEVDSNKIDVLSLDPSVEVPSCLKNVSDFPVALNNPTTATFPSPAGFGPGLPTVCGGGSWPSNFESIQWPNYVRAEHKCYQLNLSDNPPKWVEIGIHNPRYAAGLLKKT